MPLSPKTKEKTARTPVSAPKNGAKPAPQRDAMPKDHLEIRIWLRLLASSSRLESILQSRITKEFGT